MIMARSRFGGSLRICLHDGGRQRSKKQNGYSNGREAKINVEKR